MSRHWALLTDAARDGFHAFPSTVDLIGHLCRRFARDIQVCLYL